LFGNATGDVDVWMFAPTQQFNGDLSACWGVLVHDEQTRARHFVATKDRNGFIAGRAAVRQILASYLGCEPSTVRFLLGPHGKPELAGPSRLHCNWSHSGSMWLLAVATRGPVGIDVEVVDEGFDWEEVAEFAFHRRERDYVESTIDGRCRRFYEVWTRKEALLKSLGEGLNDDMNLVSVVSHDGDLARVVSLPNGSETSFAGFEVPGGVAAVAAQFAIGHLACPTRGLPPLPPATQRRTEIDLNNGRLPGARSHGHQHDGSINVGSRGRHLAGYLDPKWDSAAGGLPV
jgi:4'-phosphopantetheinyl transferase